MSGTAYGRGGAAPSSPSPVAGWVVVAAFCALVALTQVLWLTFAPVATSAAALWDVDPATVGDLTVISPLAFVLLAWPAGRWLDRALSRALAAGALLTAGGAVVRVLDPAAVAVVALGQVVLSLGQPLVLGATTAVVVRALPEGRRTAGIAAASAAQLVGILLAAVSAPRVVEARGVEGLLEVQALVAVLVCAALLGLLSRSRLGGAAVPGEVGASAVPATFAALVGDPLLRALAACLFVGVGLFNAVATWLEPVLAVDDLDLSAGGVLARMTAAGVVGAALLGPWATRRGLRKQLMVSAGAVSALGLAAVALTSTPVVAEVALVVVGLVLLSGLPVALEWAERHVGPVAAGRTTSLLLWSGNLGGVLLVLAVQPLVPRGDVALLAMAALALPAVGAAAVLPGRPRRVAELVR